MLRIGLTAVSAPASPLSRPLQRMRRHRRRRRRHRPRSRRAGHRGLAKLVDAFGERHPAAGRCAQPSGVGGEGVSATTRSAQDAQRHRAPAGGASGAPRSSPRCPRMPVIVEDIPLLVESGMAPLFPLVVIVHADEDLRVKRLIEQRGISRGRRARPDRRAGQRRTAPRGRRRVAGQLGQRGRAGRSAHANCGTSASSRSRTTCSAGEPARRHRGWCPPTRPGPTRRSGSWPG